MSLFASLTRGNILLSESWTASSRKRYGTMPMTSKFLSFQGEETRVVNNTHSPFPQSKYSKEYVWGDIRGNLLLQHLPSSRSISRQGNSGFLLFPDDGDGRPRFPALQLRVSQGYSFDRPDLIKTFATMGLGPSRNEEKTSTNQSTSR